MTTDDAKQILDDAASAHGREASDLWDRLTSELRVPIVAGDYAAYGVVKQMCNQAIEVADTEADAHDMAQALRSEVKDRMEPTSVDTIDTIEASYIWALGETGDVTMDTELTFGKHEGLTLRQLFESDRDYANWIVNEMKTNRPYLATFLALEEDSRREDEEHTHVYWREEDHLAK